MSPLSMVFTYILAWWIVLFMVLPFGSHAEKNPPLGHGTSAPKKPYLIQKLIATSLISLIVVFFVRYCLVHRVIPLDVL